MILHRVSSVLFRPAIRLTEAKHIYLPPRTTTQILRHGSTFIDRIEKEIGTRFASPGDSPETYNPNRPPYETDVVIIGGGIMGSSIAYFLKRDSSAGINVLVVERDSTYTRSATTLSVGGIRQQFSIPGNVEMSLYSANFIKTIKEHLCVDDADPPDVQFNQGGYLFLASEEGVDQMRKNHKMQREYGALIDLLTPAQLKTKFPWLNTDDIAMGSYGIENEGWFDPWSLLKAFKEKALSLGATYVNAEVTGFNIRHTPWQQSDQGSYSGSGRTLQAVKVRLPNSPETVAVKCAIAIVAAGPWSGDVAKLLDIGTGSKEHLLDVPLPVCPRKRYVYMVHAPDGPGLECPLVCDNSGVYVRREGLGGNYLCGRSPECEADEPCIDDLQVDYDFFDEKVWPLLAHRIPCLENLKLKSAWAGYYDYNTLDQNAIIGKHPAYPNIYFATGFSGHGIQQAPAVGQAISDLILEGKFCAIDLSAFNYGRIMRGEQLQEKNVV